MGGPTRASFFFGLFVSLGAKIPRLRQVAADRVSGCQRGRGVSFGNLHWQSMLAPFGSLTWQSVLASFGNLNWQPVLAICSLTGQAVFVRAVSAEGKARLPG
jgi:hypothetical protein